MNSSKVDFRDLMKVIDKCKGDVRLVSTDGNTINMKSKLSQIIGLIDLIEGGQIDVLSIEAMDMADKARITRFFLYGEV